MAGIKPEHAVLSQVTNYTASLQRYREYVAMTLVTWPAMWAELSKPRWSNASFRLYRYKQSTVAKFWAETVRGARVRCNSAATGRPIALAYGAASFSGGGSRGSRGVPVKHMLREACKQFPGSVVLVHEFRTSRVSSAHTDVVAGQPESFRWRRPVRSMATRSRIRGLMCSTSNGIRFYDRDVSAALNIRRIAAGPGRPRELSSWVGRPAMPNPGRPGQEWVCVRDRGLLRKRQRRHQRQRYPPSKKPRAMDWFQEKAAQIEKYLSEDLLTGWSPANVPNLTGKVALVTGANSGMGYATALKLAENGAELLMLLLLLMLLPLMLLLLLPMLMRLVVVVAVVVQVFLVTRDIKDGIQAAERMRAEVGSHGKALKLHQLQCDMKSLQNVVQLAEEFKKQSQKLDILVNMAGVFYPGPLDKTKEGIEQTLGINFFAPALLCLLLLDRLKATHGSRIVNMGSAAEAAGKLQWDNLKGELYKDSGLTP
ncbi:hypothetical protein QJQ45_017514 [Haematococcus lacustris]|nr:hypothetical protein QJQ45_017514 [Haematococcus lacustris]